VDPDEDEPHLEEAWPHLQLVYELFLKFMMSNHIPRKVMADSISTKFISFFLELLDSEDPRERDYLKTILHRIYGKFMVLRPYIRKQVMNLILHITYEKEEHNGLTELLEILSSIICGFATPLKEEHKEFAKRVLIPLHKVRGLQVFNTQLLTCMKNFLEKDKALGVDLINSLLKYWPITAPAKEVVYINEIEEILENIGADAERRFNDYGPKLLKRLVITAQNMQH
jgi:serine/threonine-protein phosphatase 2A regulatory subunit B'